MPKRAVSSPRNLPPGPKGGLPIWRVRELRRNILPALSELIADHGDIASMRVWPFRMTVLQDPELIRQVLVRDHAKFEKSYGMKRMRGILGNGLLVSDGAFHRRQRKLIQPAFHREPLRGYAEAMTAAAQAARARWQDGATVEMDQEMARLTLAIVGKTLFNADVEAEADAVGEALTEVLDFFPRMLLPWTEWLLWLPLPSHRKFRAARARLDATIYRLIEERLARGERGRSLIDMLLQARDEDGGAMTPEQVRDEAMTLFLAGHETTAVGLTWTWRLLAEHPEVRARLDAELDAALGGRSPGYDDLDALTYTRKVFQEAMRLYPPAYVFGRSVLEDYPLGDYVVPSGRSLLFISPYLLHRDARFFPEPERFDPDRWTPEFEAALPKCAYLPFGAGPRVCIGASFAWMEATLLLAELAQHWRPELVPGQDIAPDPMITLRLRDPLRMILRRRTPGSGRAAAPAAASERAAAAGCPFHNGQGSESI